MVIRTSRWSKVGMATVWYVMGLTFPEHCEETTIASSAFRPADWLARGRRPISIPKDSKILHYFSTMCGR